MACEPNRHRAFLGPARRGTAQDLFAHENLSFKIIQEYMTKFFRRCILFNPRFIWRRLIRGIRTGEFFWDAYYALKWVC